MKGVFISIFCLFVSIKVHAITHENKKVLTIYGPEPDRACTLFQLNGVGTADPIRPNKPWFALPQSHIGHDETLSLLLSAYMSQKDVNIVTTGEVSSECGHSEIKGVYFSY